MGEFYHTRGSNPAAANRLAGVIAQYPLYSGAPDALWLQADSYSKMGKNFRAKTGEAIPAHRARLPALSKWADPAKKKLQEMVNGRSAARSRQSPSPAWSMRKENYVRPGLMKRSSSFLARGPDMSHAAKSGAPALSTVKPSIPASVPGPVETALGAGGTTAPGAPAGGGTTDVTISTGLEKGTSLDTKPDARLAPPGGAAPATPVAAAQPAGPDPLPMNHTGTQKKLKAGKASAKKTKKDQKKDPPKKEAKKSKKDKNAPAAAQTAQPPASSTTATTAASAKE